MNTRDNADDLHEKLADATGDRLITRFEFCAMLNVSLSTAERWAQIKHGPQPIRVGPRRLGYRLRDVREFLQSNSGQNS